MEPSYSQNDFQYGVRPPSLICEFLNFCHFCHLGHNLRLHIKFCEIDSRLRYGAITILKMAVVRHVGFIVTSSYCTGRRV